MEEATIQLLGGPQGITSIRANCIVWRLGKRGFNKVWPLKTHASEGMQQSVEGNAGKTRLVPSRVSEGNLSAAQQSVNPDILIKRIASLAAAVRVD